MECQWQFDPKCKRTTKSLRSSKLQPLLSQVAQLLMVNQGLCKALPLIGSSKSKRLFCIKYVYLRTRPCLSVHSLINVPLFPHCPLYHNPLIAWWTWEMIAWAPKAKLAVANFDWSARPHNLPQPFRDRSTWNSSFKQPRCDFITLPLLRMM